jgi:hypothetical protein
MRENVAEFISTPPGGVEGNRPRVSIRVFLEGLEGGKYPECGRILLYSEEGNDDSNRMACSGAAGSPVPMPEPPENEVMS